MGLSTLTRNGEEEWLERKNEQLSFVVCVKSSMQARYNPGIDVRKTD